MDSEACNVSLGLSESAPPTSEVLAALGPEDQHIVIYRIPGELTGLPLFEPEE